MDTAQQFISLRQLVTILSFAPCKRQHRSGMGFQLFGSLSSSPSITCPQDLHEAAFDCVTCTPQDVAGCIAKAHFCVVGHIFEPYMGQQ